MNLLSDAYRNPRPQVNHNLKKKKAGAVKAELWSKVIHAYTASEVMAPKLKTEEVTVEESDFTAKNDSPWLCVSGEVGVES